MKNVPISAVLAIVFGLLIIFVPQLISYLIGVYLVVTGFMMINRRR